MTDTSPEALDALEKRLRAGYFSHDPLLTLGGVKHDPRCLEAADTIAALRAAPVAMRERIARAEDEAYARGEMGNPGHRIRALPLDAPAPAWDRVAQGVFYEAPAPVDPVAEAARVLLSDDITISKMAQAIHDGPLGADDEWFSAARPQGSWCVDAVRAALRALAQEARHD
jgi:hypothetical protein